MSGRGWSPRSAGYFWWRSTSQIPTLWRLQRNIILEIRKGLWFLLSYTPAKKTYCSFNTFIYSLPSAWLLPGTLEGSKNHNSNEIRYRPEIYVRSASCPLRANYLISRFKGNPKTHWGNLLTASQFVFRACHSTRLQCVRLADHVTLNFNNNMSTVAVFLDIEKAFDTTWHSGLLHKLPELEFLIFSPTENLKSW
jgi:hypothetical protein